MIMVVVLALLIIIPLLGLVTFVQVLYLESLRLRTRDLPSLKFFKDTLEDKIGMETEDGAGAFSLVKHTLLSVVGILYFAWFADGSPWHAAVFWQAVAAVVLGNALASVAHGVLSARGPEAGVPQMVLGRLAFGFKGNAVPAVLMSVTAGVGWFATNSVSGAYALAALFGIGPLVGLIIIVLVQTAFAFFGHNLVQAFERWSFPVLAIIFAIASVAILTKSHFGAPALEPIVGDGSLGGFLLTVGTAFGYAAGWTPYAADYTRYLPSTVSTALTGLYASAGLFLSCAVLEIVGAASVTIGPALSENPTEAFTGELASPVAKATLLAIAIGAIAANSINIYSGAMAFVTIGIKLPAQVARALVTVFFGVAGFLVAWWALPDAAASYEAFLLIIAYWIGPWLGVVFADQYLRRGQTIRGHLYDRSYANWGGLLSFLVGLLVSVLLFSNQAKFVGVIAKALPQLGDITFFVGFLLAGAAYLVLCRSKIAAEKG